MTKIFIAIPAYNCQNSITRVIQRIPASLHKRIAKIVIANDASQDNTAKVLTKLTSKYPKIKVLTNKSNQRYAGTQKVLYKFALKNEADIVVLLHDDGQYAPEEMDRLIEPIINNQADVVQGSRMLGNPLAGGMPISKYLGNIIMGQIENLICGMKMAEWHSGYMAYSKKALTTIPFAKLGQSFHFDGEMLFMAHKKSLVIKQVPISTNFYGDARSYLQPIKYIKDWLQIMQAYQRGEYDKL